MTESWGACRACCAPSVLSVFHDLGRNLSHVAAFENTLFDIGSNRGSQVKIDVEVKFENLVHAWLGEVVFFNCGDISHQYLRLNQHRKN